MHPSFNGDCLVNLMASLEAACANNAARGQTAYGPLQILPAEELRERTKTVLFVIDGLGFNRLQSLESDHAMKHHLRGSLRSVFPSTTATAVTTIFTGVGPLQHGVTGWHIWSSLAGGMITPLPFTSREDDAPLPLSADDLFPAPALVDRLSMACHLVLPGYICDSTYSKRHGGRSARWPFEGLDAMFDRVLALLAQPGPAYIHAYWPDFDAISHRHGTWSEPAEDHLRRIDEAFGRFLARCPRDETAVLLTADHGFIDAKESDKVSLEYHPELETMLERPLCGEPRVAYCYPKAGAQGDVCAYIDEQLAFAVARYPAEKLLRKGYFGFGDSHPQFAERIGDQILVARARHVLGHGFGTDEVIFKLTGFHGGISEDEMLIPLIFVQP